MDLISERKSDCLRLLVLDDPLVNSRLLPHLAWAALAAIAFTAGYVSEDGSRKQRPSQARSARRKPVASALDASGKETGESANSTNDEKAGASFERGRVQMFEILSEADHLERYRKLVEFIPHISKENWRGVLDAFAVQRRTMGRTFGVELQMVAERIGAVAGEEALNEYLNPRNTSERQTVAELMRGWVRADRTAAVAWFQNLDEWKQKEMRSPLVSAAISKDPREAMDLVVADIQAGRAGDMGALMEMSDLIGTAIYRYGWADSEKLLSGVESQENLPDSVKGMMFLRLAQSKLQVLRDTSDTGVTSKLAFDTLDWYQQYVGKSYMGAQSTSEIITAATKSDPARALDWMEKYAPSLTTEQQYYGYIAFVRTWREQSADDFSNWMNAHPDDPQREQMAATAAECDFATNQPATGEHWMAMVQDPNMLARLQGIAANAAKAKALEPPQNQNK